jgi:hypothetical protein
VQIPALKERELVMLGKIDEVRQTESPVIQTARDEIQRLRESAEDQVVNSQALIERLRSQLAQTDKADEIDAAVDEQLLKIKTSEAELDTLVEQKYSLQAEYRKLEAEVGPIKYIAEFVYGEQADNTMLEDAVRWVIIIIIFVFDPLAVLLLIASQYTFEFRRKQFEDDSGERLRQYEHARAQRIVDNPGYNIDDPAPTQEKEEVDGTVDEPTDSDIQDVDVEHNERDREADDEESLPGRSDVEPNEEQVPDSDQTQERTSTEQDPRGSATASQEVDDSQKKSLESSEELNQNLENWNKWVEAAEQEVAKETKQIPDTKNRIFYTEELDNDKQQYIMKEKGKQVTKETKPESSEGESQTGYIQNAEQNNDTLWKKMKDDGK